MISGYLWYRAVYIYWTNTDSTSHRSLQEAITYFFFLSKFRIRCFLVFVTVFPSTSIAVPHKSLSILPSFKQATELYFRYVSLWSIEISENVAVLGTPSRGFRRSFLQGLSGKGMKLTTCLHLVLGLIINEGVTPLSLMS